MAASRAADAARSRPPPPASACVAAAAAVWHTITSRTRLVLAQQYQARYSSNSAHASAMRVHLSEFVASPPGDAQSAVGEPTSELEPAVRGRLRRVPLQARMATPMVRIWSRSAT